jgi:diguanylate cyclase (GGDEF)-like protein/PAS domain S-box-containing protein
MGLDGGVIIFNQRFVDLWSLAEGWETIANTVKRLSMVLVQLCDPDGFVQRIEDVLQHPEQDSYDEIAFRDGRVFSRHGAPYRIGDRLLGRLWNYHDITERKRMEEALRESKQFIQRIADVTPALIYVFDLVRGYNTFANAYTLTFFGCTMEELQQQGQELIFARLHPDDLSQMAAFPVQWNDATDKQVFHREYCMQNAAGDWRYLDSDEVVFQRDEHGTPTHILGVAIDVTARKQAEEALHESEERYLRAVTAGKVGVWEWNLTTNEMYLAPNLKAMLGYADHEIRNHLDDWGRFVHPDDQQLVMDAAAACLRGETDTYEVEHRMLHKDGSVRWMVARGLVSRDAQGHPVRMVGTDTDITERKQAEEQLHRANVLLKQQAIRDGLTGLHNRRYLDETLPRELQRAERQKQSVGIIMLDIDYFKPFNDTYGHDAGDTLLRAMGAVLQEHTRGADIVCRYGGEEFTLVLPGASLAATQQRAEELRTEVQALMVEHGEQVLAQVTISLGIAVFPEHGMTADSLIRAADQALYQAKRSGRNRVEVVTMPHSEA